MNFLEYKKLKNQYKEQQIFILPYISIDKISNNFTRKVHDKNIWSYYDNKGKYIFRYDAEYSPFLLQLMPFVILKYNKRFLVNINSNSYSLGNSTIIDYNEVGTINILQKAVKNILISDVSKDLIKKTNFIGYHRELTKTNSNKLRCVFVTKVNELTNNSKHSIWMSIIDLEKTYFKFDRCSKDIINYLVKHKGGF